MSSISSASIRMESGGVKMYTQGWNTLLVMVRYRELCFERLPSTVGSERSSFVAESRERLHHEPFNRHSFIKIYKARMT